LVAIPVGITGIKKILEYIYKYIVVVEDGKHINERKVHFT